MATIQVPSHLKRDFSRFAEDFNVASADWVRQGYYTQSEVDVARDELRALLTEAISRDDTQALTFWFGLFSRLAMAVPAHKVAA